MSSEFWAILRLTGGQTSSIMQVLLNRNFVAPWRARSSLDQQSSRLLGYFDALFRRLMLTRPGKEEECAPEMSREEMRTLIVLGTAGRVTMTSLADGLGVPLSTATHTIDRLVAKSLAVRTRSEQDRRIVHVEISDLGKTLQANLRVKHLAMARSWLEPLSPGEREIFLELMGKITQHARPNAAPHGRSEAARQAQPEGGRPE
jgi:MarR family transcriptional regulator, organic hydroperoxide resistance regulator